MSSWDHFTTEELACRHCGEMHMNERFMADLVALRKALGFPFPVSSGYRCPEYNNQVSSTGFDGPHTTGCAVDIALRGDKARALIGAAIALHVFEGIGVKQTGGGRFVHLDKYTGIHPRPWVWSY